MNPKAFPVIAPFFSLISLELDELYAAVLRCHQPLFFV